MTQGNSMKLIFQFFLPILIGNLFQQLYSFVDSMVVGKGIGDVALAAVGNTSSVHFLILGFAMGLTGGLGICISHSFGANDIEKLRKEIAMSVYICLAIGIVITVGSLFWMRRLFVFLQTPEDMMTDTLVYFGTILAGSTVTIFNNFAMTLLRSVGNSKVPLASMIVSSVVNIVLDLLFVFPFGMGVFGAAFATVLSQGVSGVLCIIYIAKNVPLLHVSRNDLELDSSYVRNLMVMGLPMGFQYSITAIGSVILQTAVNGLGSIAVASMTAASRISMFMVCPFDALGSTMATYSGQNVGAAKFERVKKGLISASVIGSVYSVLIFVALLFIANYLIYLFVSPSETEVVAQAHQFLLINAFFYIPLVLVNTVRFTIQGMGFSGFAMFAGVAEMIARSLIGLVFVPIFGFSAACFASPLAWILADAFLVPAFIHCLHKLQKAKSSQVTSL